MSEKIYLGTIDVTDGARTLVVPDLNADPDTIRAAIEQAERARVEEARAASQRLRAAMGFLPDETRALDEPPPKPRARDWLVP